MLKIRNLEEPDLAGLSRFITEIYREYPTSMWFESEPSQDLMTSLFSSKIAGIRQGNVVDIVAIDSGPERSGSIVGEAEIARLAGKVGYVGVIIGKDHRRKGLGSLLLDRALDRALESGITELKAEVAESNMAAQEFFQKQGFSLAGEKESKRSKRSRTRRLLLFEKKLR